MAIGAITSLGKAGNKPSAPTPQVLISFAGDGAYPTGGTAGFKALVQAITGDGRDILAVVGQDCGGFTPVYDKANDKLKVFRTGAINVPMEEVPNATNLSATTFRVLVISP